MRPRPRGIHLVHAEVIAAAPDLADVDVGLLHVFIQHTSASLLLTENADPDVRGDLQRHLDILAPQAAPHYRHNDEGPDDMPAHIGNALLGASLTLPISRGRLALGTWQGICLCEHRIHGGTRRLVLTVQGRTA